MLRHRSLLALTAALLLAACNANVSVTPNPSPTPTASPTATPTPSPTPTPGWVSATIRPTAETNDAVLAEVRKLETEGKVANVIVMESFPVQIRLSAAPATIKALEELAAGVKTVSFTTLSQRSSNIQAAGTRVAGTQTEFTTLWNQHTSTFDSPPSINFDTQSVLAVFAGERPTGGYTAAITSVKRLNKTLTVSYKVTAPPEGSSNIQVITYPAHIVSIPLSKQKGDYDTVNFVKE